MATAAVFIATSACGIESTRRAVQSPTAAAPQSAPSTSIATIGGDPINLTTSPPPENSEGKGRPGDTATITEGGERVGTVRVITVKSYPRGFSDYDRPKNGQYLSVDITVEAISEGFDINPFDFFVRTPDGRRFDPTVAYEAPEPSLDYSELNPGEKIRGYVTFDVPRGHGEVVYAPQNRGLFAWAF